MKQFLFSFACFCPFILFHLCCASTGKVDEKATQLHAIASLKVLLDATKPQRGAATSTAANNVKINYKETMLVGDRPNGNIDTTLESVSSFFAHSIFQLTFANCHQSFAIVFYVRASNTIF